MAAVVKRAEGAVGLHLCGWWDSAGCLLNGWHHRASGDACLGLLHLGREEYLVLQKRLVRLWLPFRIAVASGRWPQLRKQTSQQPLLEHLPIRWRTHRRRANRLVAHVCGQKSFQICRVAARHRLALTCVRDARLHSWTGVLRNTRL